MFTITSQDHEINSHIVDGDIITEKITSLKIDDYYLFNGLIAHTKGKDEIVLASFRDVNNEVILKEDKNKMKQLRIDIIKAMEEYEKRTNPYESYHYKITPDFKLERIYL